MKATAGLLCLCIAPLMPLLAHHSFSAEFDGSKAVELKGVVTTVVYGFVVSFALLKIIDKTIGLRVSEEQEREGLDISLHGESIE